MRHLGQLYHSYRDDSVNHRMRIIGIVFASLLISIFGNDFGKSAFDPMSLAISILAGFTYTSLFSSHSMTTSDLPPPKNENDRHDRAKLRSLSENFRVRSRFFIIFAVIDLLLIILVSINFSKDATGFDWERLLAHDWLIWMDGNVFDLFRQLPLFFTWLFGFFIFLIFFECMYTFYRLSETMMAILDIRRTYLDSHADESRKG